MNNVPTTGIKRSCEEALLDYLISTIDPQQLSATYYSGQGNVLDLQAPAILVSTEQGNEVFMDSNVYELFTKVSVKEMAADTSSGSLGVLGLNVMNAFSDPNRVQKINASNSWSFAAFQIQKLDTSHEVNQDTLIDSISLRVIGCMATGSV
jgi:hypothetical protein